MTLQTSADQTLVRELNLSLVLQLIHNEAPLSRSQIAQITGLNKSTVSSLVENLMELHLVHETGINQSGTGRPSRLLAINSLAGGIIGVEFGVDFVTVAITDFAGNVKWRKTVPATPTDGQDKTLNQSLKLIHKAINYCEENSLGILGLGIAAPGIVDIDKGVLVFAPNLQWYNVHLKEFFEEHLRLKVFIENDANAAAVGEHLFGKARRDTDFILLFVGVGIGGGLFQNGKLYRGKDGFAGEIGHIPVFAEPFQAKCQCGNRGCLETYANQHTLLQKTQTLLKNNNNNSILSQYLAQQGNVLSISMIKQAADAGDRISLEVLSDIGMVIGQGIASLVNIFNPEKIILGGTLSIAGEYLLTAIEKTITKRTHPLSQSTLEIQISDFGPDASLIGAIAIVVENILTHPLSVERR